MTQEPTISINSHQLTEGQAATIRVALGRFTSSLKSEGLGEDEHGQRMTAAYLARISEINSIIAGHNDWSVIVQ